MSGKVKATSASLALVFPSSSSSSPSRNRKTKSGVKCKCVRGRGRERWEVAAVTCSFAARRSSGSRSFGREVIATERRKSSAALVMAAASSGSASGTGERDLLVVGPGVLGKLLAKQWKDSYPGFQVVGETATDMNHESLQASGCFDGLRSREGGMESTTKYPFVVFAAPPSGSENYLEEVERAVDKWDGTGTFLFTSSAAVYDVETGPCNEESKVKAMGDSERTDRLLACENAVLEKGGNVVRLVGLYHSKRGAHMYFLKIQTVPRWGESCINLIHYEDAADLCYKILVGEEDGEAAAGYHRGQIFLGCDNNPVSFQKMMDATFLSGEYKGHCKFTGEAQEFVGKLATNNLTRERLSWEPKFESYEAFMSQGAKDTFV